MATPGSPVTTIYPNKIEEALANNMFELVMATRNIVVWSSIDHPEKYRYWTKRQDKLRRKRQILLNMRERSGGLPYEREGGPEIP